MIRYWWAHWRLRRSLFQPGRQARAEKAYQQLVRAHEARRRRR